MADSAEFLPRLEAFLGKLGVASLSLDEAGRAHSWNGEFLRLFPEQAGSIQPGQPLAEILRRTHPDADEASLAEDVERHRRQGEPFEVLHRGRRLRVAALDVPGHGRLHAWVPARSLPSTERLSMQAAHAASRIALGPEHPQSFAARLETLLDSLGIAALLLDEDARTLGWNLEFVCVFPEHAGAIHRNEPYAENLRRFYRARLDAGERPNMEAYVADGVERHRRQVEPFEFLHRGRWLRVAVLPLPGLGRLRAWTPCQPLRDGDRLAIQMAQGGKRPALGAMEYIADGLMVRDPAGRILLCNRRFAELYGLESPDHAAGMTFPELLDAAWAGAPEAAAAQKGWADNSRFPGAPFELPLPDDRWVRVRDFRANDGTLVSTHVDVTDLFRMTRRATEAQARAEDLAAQLSLEMERRRRSEARTVQMARLVSLGEMATALAHELNQPLAALTIAADLARIRLETRGAEAIPDALERLERVAATAVRARDIVDHLRLFGRAEEHGPAEEPLDLRDAVKGALTLVRASIRAAGIALETRLPASPVFVTGRLVALEQVVLNLLMNARDAVAGKHADGGTIRLDLQEHDGEALLTVADNGGGFTEAGLYRGLEPFFTTKPSGQGTGIGLSISQSTIEAAGGRISLANGAEGAVVSVRLPLHAAALGSA